MNCTDSRPRARRYQLRGLPLEGLECVCPQRNFSCVFTRGSGTAFDLPVHLSRTCLKRKQKKWNSRHKKCPTVKYSIVRPRRYKRYKACGHKIAVKQRKPKHNWEHTARRQRRLSQATALKRLEYKIEKSLPKSQANIHEKKAIQQEIKMLERRRRRSKHNRSKHSRRERTTKRKREPCR